jgi:hypothetical protein
MTDSDIYRAPKERPFLTDAERAARDRLIYLWDKVDHGSTEEQAAALAELDSRVPKPRLPVRPVVASKSINNLRTPFKDD